MSLLAEIVELVVATLTTSACVSTLADTTVVDGSKGANSPCKLVAWTHTLKQCSSAFTKECVKIASTRARHVFEYGLGARDRGGPVRQHVTKLTVDFIANTHFECQQAIKHIELGNAQTRNTIEAY